MEPLIQIRDLRVRRGNHQALCLSALEIYKGETLALLGPNGAGKSTLLLTLARLLQPARGGILFEGRPLAEWGELAYRRQIAVVFEQPLLMNATLLENVMLGLRFRGLPQGEAYQRAMYWLERLGIAHLAKRRAGQISAGEAQRASLARAFALDPLLLLLDEPFASLDPPTRLRLLEETKALLQENHRTAIFVSHHLQEAAFLADRVAILMEGQLRQIGSVEEIKARPADEAVAAFCALFE